MLFEFATVVVIAFAGVLRHIIADKLPSVGLEAVLFSKHRSVSKIQLLVFCVTMFSFFEVVTDWILTAKLDRYQGWALGAKGNAKIKLTWIMYAIACAMPMSSI